MLLRPTQQPRQTLYRSLSNPGLACGGDINFTLAYQGPELIFNSYRPVSGHEIEDVVRIVDTCVLDTDIQVRQNLCSHLSLHRRHYHSGEKPGQ